MERVIDRTDRKSGLLHALAVAAAALSRVGVDPVEMVTISRRRVCLQPVHMSDGEGVAQALGLDLPMDHRMIAPAYTVWSGDRDGLEMQVRSVLRQGVGAAR